ncbi:hypothetical protein CHLRE_09g390245v5 [Chlamydomonas reinhardtii]|uniref:Uncharacterized protein n=1 Tax=Chlamydomonas reinhardtii TaxID=3055 RepID=A0A2K3DE31_CHLRE|nr:uncharacterized protein CHLRE_09g390245v5 [Chlamydomonas reinhardtii]PNW78790.1 hypothetical protein CHLRE_09g390245v5 [Chlamydomonas reinhardtii]
MLRRVKAHAQGIKLHDALSNSPLTIVFQCIGNVKAAQLEDSLKAQVTESPDGLNATPISFRVKNRLATATGRADVSAFLQATNVLVGWELRTKEQAESSASMGTGSVSVRLADRLMDVVASTSAPTTADAPPRKQPPQRTLAAIIKASLELSKKFPVAPLAGFFHGQRIRLADLARWSELDDKAVYGELIAQLESVPAGLVSAVNVGDAGISSILDGQSAPLLLFLAAKQAEAEAAAAAGAGQKAAA